MLEARRVWGRERARQEARFGPIETRETSGPGDASRLAIELREAGHDLLSITGGDGTLNEAANGLLAGGCPAPSMTLAPLAAGHCSDLARALAQCHSLPVGQALSPASCGLSDMAGRKACPTEPRLIDAVQATFHDAGGRICERWFVNMAGFGPGAEVVRRGAGSGRSAYLLAAAVAPAGRRPMELRLSRGRSAGPCGQLRPALLGQDLRSSQGRAFPDCGSAGRGQGRPRTGWRAGRLSSSRVSRRAGRLVGTGSGLMSWASLVRDLTQRSEELRSHRTGNAGFGATGLVEPELQV